jgi:hypothetical protein
MDYSAVERLEAVSNYGAHRHLVDQFVQTRKLVVQGECLTGEDMEEIVLGDKTKPGSMHSILSKIKAPPLYQVEDGNTLTYEITSDASVKTLTGTKFEKNSKAESVEVGNRPWHVNWLPRHMRADEQKYFKTDIMADGNKAGSYASELTNLIGTVSAGQIDKSTTSGIMVRKIEGTDLRHLMIKGVLYLQFLVHMYTIKHGEINIGAFDAKSKPVPHDYILTSIHDGSKIIVNREVLTVETNTILRLCAAQYPVMVAEGMRTKYTNIHMMADELSIVSFPNSTGVNISPGLVLHPERWWEGLCNVAAVMGGVRDLCFAVNYAMGWPDAYDIMRQEGLRVNGSFDLNVPLSRSIDTLFGDSNLRRVDVIAKNTNKICSSSMIILNKIVGASIVGLALDTIDDFGLMDDKIYGAGLANSELAHGVLLDFGIGIGGVDCFVDEIMTRHGKYDCPRGVKYRDIFTDWPRLIHSGYRRHGDWQPVVLDCVEVGLFGPRSGGLKMGLLSETWRPLTFTSDDVNYTHNGAKSWEVSAWCVLNGFYERNWLFVGPFIASKVGMGPVERVFSETRFSIAGQYELTGNGISVTRVWGKKGCWKDKSDRFEMNDYYQGAFTLLEGVFTPPINTTEEIIEPIDTTQARSTSTLRHQPKTTPIDIDIRDESERPIDEVIDGTLGEEVFFEIVKSGENLEDVVEGFGPTMQHNVKLMLPTTNEQRVLWCSLEPDNERTTQVLVLVAEQACHLVVPTGKKFGAIDVHCEKKAVFSTKWSQIPREHVDNLIFEAKPRSIRKVAMPDG